MDDNDVICIRGEIMRLKEKEAKLTNELKEFKLSDFDTVRHYQLEAEILDTKTEKIPFEEEGVLGRRMIELIISGNKTQEFNDISMKLH